MDKCQTTAKCTFNKAKIHNSGQNQLPLVLGGKVRDICLYMYTGSLEENT